MKNVIGIKVYDKEGIYYVEDKYNKYQLNEDIIIVEDNSTYLSSIISKENIDDNNVFLNNIIILRTATEEDKDKYEKNKENRSLVLSIISDTVSMFNLDMKIICANYSLDRTKLRIKYFSEGRVDFRNILKELAMIFKTRIELYQVNEREHSRELSGLGPCGKPLCCSSFLDDFHQVSLKMAKDQNLLFNMSKITGICGKLLCCLKYENEYYVELSKILPDIGKKITFNSECYYVRDIEPIKEIIILEHEETREKVVIKIDEFIKEFKDDKCEQLSNG